ncbi:uncharacterized protein MYCFIDRAFT_214731 [Pseudocercospora fijiensis CIRAD86]|uniref:Zn(2)-C6 fungal-type domain-containing protein n=1 Tax=Pseudocercospora fijiensis (strain CIRAD86) TaxID=383855 RepID=M3AIJ6_PSEFD|nr:uncharacterized protein MYCFIDRAFT_214731 [Pseudocercospora fijiensis CIRAD86]EME84421.1 hypothetical protein MYCFIDRAFT_214731 [Pseudocercospora fijiensis CIRAD86]
MTIPVVRKRAKRPKTRTGCRTCRARHIKCTEERPACQRCVSSNRECAGYDVPPPRIGKPQCILLPKGAEDLPMLYPMDKPATIAFQMSSYEVHAFDFFRSHTVHQLPGSSWTLSWDRLALQVGHHEPAITHATVALGSIHRAITYSSTTGAVSVDPDQHLFALNQYNKAMSYIRRYIEGISDKCTDWDVEVVLLVSLLFFCFEIMHSEDARATMHLRTGLRILYERLRRMDAYKAPQRMIDIDGEEKRVVRLQSRPRNNMDLLLQTFVRLDGDLTIIGDEEPYLMPMCHEHLPTSFSSLEEALVHLDAIAGAAHSNCRDIVIMADRELSSQRPDLESMDEDMRNCLSCAYSRTIKLTTEFEERIENDMESLNAWMTALAHMPESGQKQSAQFLIQIHFFYIWFIITSWRDENEMQIDRFEAQFAHIVTLAEAYVEMHSDVTCDAKTEPGQPYHATRQAFTVGTDLVPCISMIAFKSRKSSIRRRCIELLRTINMQGVFDSWYLASFAQLVADLEEKRAREITGKPEGVDLEASDVPEAARFVEIELSPANHTEYRHSFYKGGMGRLCYVYKDDEGRLLADEAMFKVKRPADLPGAANSHHCSTGAYEITDFDHASIKDSHYLDPPNTQGLVSAPSRTLPLLQDVEPPAGGLV